jgi:integrase
MSSLKKYKDNRGNSTAHLYIDVKTRTFWAVVRVGNTIKKESLKTTDKLTALANLPDVLKRLGSEADEKGEKKAPNKLLKDYWKELITQKNSVETSESTLKRMDIIWRHHLENYFGNFRPEDINSNMMPAYIEWHKKERPGTQLYNVYKYLGNILNYMYDVGAIRREQMPALDLPKKERLHHAKKKGRVISPKEYDALISKATSLRIKLLIALDYVIGARKMELVKIKKHEQITKEDGRYYIRLDESDTKTGLPRVIPVPNHLNALLEQQITQTKASAFLFPTKDGKRYAPAPVIDREWAQTKRLAQIQGRLRFHDLRGSAATNMAKQNINPIVACTILGMSISMYQKVYLQLSGKDLMISVDQLAQGAMP